MPVSNKKAIPPNPAKRIRVAVLWTRPSGYLAACLRELQANNIELFVSHRRVDDAAPFDVGDFAFFDHHFEWRGAPNTQELKLALREFNPDAILAAGWHVSGYRSILRQYRGLVPRIMCMDNQWRGTPKQWVGVVSSRFYLHPLCDQIWVSGERQAAFASRLGFSTSHMMRGWLSCDFESFSREGERRLACPKALPRAFIFSGRFVREKGLDVLREAYRRYRQVASEPWPLLVCGEGPLRPLLEHERGMRLLGFIQPSKLPEIFSKASCLVLPSRSETWGVAVHEATAAGLAVIASTEVGSAVHLVQDGYNGFLFASGDVERLTQLFIYYANCPEDTRLEMAGNSLSLARQFTPKRWASYLLDRIDVNRVTTRNHMDATAMSYRP